VLSVASNFNQVHETLEECFAAEKVSRKILGVEFSFPGKFLTVKKV
jgi:hypothetical protein